MVPLQALTYTSLAVSSPAGDNQIRDYATLVSAFAAYQSAALDAIQKAGGYSLPLNPPCL